jgi:uncharacterized damage-inducible protein DinB
MATQTMPTPKQQYLGSFNHEHATTMKVLRAYPIDKMDLRPAPKSKTARELAWMFALDQGLLEKALTTGFDWSVPPAKMPDPPASMDAILKVLEDNHQRLNGIVEQMGDERFFETVKFFVAPKTLADMPKIQFMWFVLCDQIHHRGQMSVYLRMADGKVPSIYGPTADEPWF